MENYDKKVLDLSMEAGRILLDAGAEIFRVEETVARICTHYGVESEKAFVLSNGIFLTAGNEREKRFARVKHIPVKGAQLDKVAAVNQLSREIEAGRHSLLQVKEELARIRRMPGKPAWMQVLFSGAGSGCFCALFGGGWEDCLAAFFIGIFLYLYLLACKGRFSKIVENIGGGAVITVLSLLFSQLSPDMDMSHMISGAIMPLVPGLAFTNGIRDIADGDYIAGSVRLLDAILVFVCIAAGVGLVITGYHGLTGGRLL